MPNECWIVSLDGVYPFHKGIFGPFEKDEAIKFAKSLKPDGYHSIAVHRMTHEGTAGDDNDIYGKDGPSFLEDDYILIWDSRKGWVEVQGS